MPRTASAGAEGNLGAPGSALHLCHFCIISWRNCLVIYHCSRVEIFLKTVGDSESRPGAVTGCLPRSLLAGIWSQVGAGAETEGLYHGKWPRHAVLAMVPHSRFHCMLNRFPRVPGRTTVATASQCWVYESFPTFHFLWAAWHRWALGW